MHIGQRVFNAYLFLSRYNFQMSQEIDFQVLICGRFNHAVDWGLVLSWLRRGVIRHIPLLGLKIHAPQSALHVPTTVEISHLSARQAELVRIFFSCPLTAVFGF